MNSPKQDLPQPKEHIENQIQESSQKDDTVGFQKQELPQEDKITFYDTCKTISGSIFMLNFIEFILFFILSIIFLAFHYDILDNDVSNTMSIIVTIIATIYIVKRYTNKLHFKLEFEQLTKYYSIRKFILFIFITMGVSTVFSFGINLFNEALHLVNIELTTPDFSFTSNITSNIILILTTCVVAPIFEELLFRGVILSALKRYGYKFAILTTSLLFALVHGNFIQGIPTFVMSLCFCYIVLETHSLYASIILHFINNALAMLATAFIGNDIISMMFFIFDIGCMVIAFIVLIKKRAMIKSILVLKEEYKVRNFFNNWVAILFLVIILLVFLSTIISI